MYPGIAADGFIAALQFFHQYTEWHQNRNT